MSYNPYGGSPYGLPPGIFPAYPPPRSLPDMMSPPGLGPPPGMSSAAPGMAPPPGVQQPSSAQANRPSGLPPAFQPPPNLPNINFNAPVIRLGTPSHAPVSSSNATAIMKPPTGPGGPGGGGGRHAASPITPHPDRGAGGGGGGRSDYHRGERGERAAAREAAIAAQLPPSGEEKLRTLLIHKIPPSVVDVDVERLLSAMGTLRRWEAVPSVLDGSKGLRFGIATFEDIESFTNAADLLADLELPLVRQSPTPEGPEGKDETFEGVEKTKLLYAIDPSSQKYVDHHKQARDDDGGRRQADAKQRLKSVLLDLFYPKSAALAGADGDVAMGGAAAADGGAAVEVVNIPLAVEDELADIPAEMREIVAGEIASFRERSNRRDMERIKKEEELEEIERQRSGAARLARLGTPPPTGAVGVNNIPVKPRGGLNNPPSGPKGQNGGGGGGGRSVAFVNGDGGLKEDDDTDASDDELHRRQVEKQRTEDARLYAEAERKWANRERSRAAAIDREADREAQGVEHLRRVREEQLELERAWDDEREASRKNHIYYHDHGAWLRIRNRDRADEEARDEMDRRAEHDEKRREEVDRERARGMADSFLDQQAQEMSRRERERDQAAASAAAAAAAAAAADALTPTTAPQPFKLSFGAAAAARAQKMQPQRRTIAEVEGLLDDEDDPEGVKRTLVPIQHDAAAAAGGDKPDLSDMTEDEIAAAVRSLAAEIPSDRDGLWAWQVSWDHVDEGSVIREKLRPFVEKKIMEYLGVQEDMLVDEIESHLRKHCKPAELVEAIAVVLDDDADDLVKKLWRMLIFFSESEKRGLPT